jgi:hypothetical protein
MENKKLLGKIRNPRSFWKEDRCQPLIRRKKSSSSRLDMGS